jgi:putative ABC transport system permease protein
MILSIAARNLLQSGRRTFFLALAIGVVTMLLVILLAVSQGITNTLIRSATVLSTGHVNVGGFYKITRGRAAPRIVEVERLRQIVRENTPGLDFLLDRQRGFGKVIGLSGSMTAAYNGVDIDEEPLFAQVLRLAPENRYHEGGSPEPKGAIADLARPHTCLLFASQAKRLGVTVGDTVTLSAETNRGVYNTLDLTVVAVAEDMGLMSDWNVYMPKASIDEIYHTASNTSGVIMVFLRDITQSESVMSHLREVLKKEGFELMDHLSMPFFVKFDIADGEDWTGQKLDLTIWKDEVIFLTYFVNAFDTISAILIWILVVIIGVGIMNAMWIAVRERTAEVGTLRAIGMSRYRVLLMFLFESLLLGLFASTLGAGLGAGVAAALNAAAIEVPIKAFQTVLLSDKLILAVRGVQVLQAILIFTAVTALSALWPAYRASKLAPITAIHYTG